MPFIGSLRPAVNLRMPFKTTRSNDVRPVHLTEDHHGGMQKSFSIRLRGKLAAKAVHNDQTKSAWCQDHCTVSRKDEPCTPDESIPESLVGAGKALSAMEVKMRRQLLGGRIRKEFQWTTPDTPFVRMASSDQYAERTQTVIILDWDDTLFPTTYVRNGLGLSIRKPLKNQDLSAREMSQVQEQLGGAAAAACSFLELACACGQVVIVTLAQRPWVTDSCRYFYPGVAELIERLGIQVVYAQEGRHVVPRQSNTMAPEQFQNFWVEVKGKAIAKALQEFYSQYEGQSWKNVISLGDSDFERYGTMAATMQYASVHGLVNEKDEVFPTTEAWAASVRRDSVGSVHSQLSVENVEHQIEDSLVRRISWEGNVSGREVKVRTKTFKMMEDPTVEEITTELSMLQEWLPLMVRLNDSFDVDLHSLDNKALINEVESMLRPLQLPTLPNFVDTD